MSDLDIFKATYFDECSELITELEEQFARIEAGEPVAQEESYCRVTPRFEVPAGPHEWLARTVFIGWLPCINGDEA